MKAEKSIFSPEPPINLSKKLSPSCTTEANSGTFPENAGILSLITNFIPTGVSPFFVPKKVDNTKGFNEKLFAADAFIKFTFFAAVLSTGSKLALLKNFIKAC